MCTEGIFLGFFALVLGFVAVVRFPLIAVFLRVSFGALRRALRAGGTAAAASDSLAPAAAAGCFACGMGCAALSRDTKCRD